MKSEKCLDCPHLRLCTAVSEVNSPFTTEILDEIKKLGISIKGQSTISTDAPQETFCLAGRIADRIRRDTF
jgi:hypothetical protein